MARCKVNTCNKNYEGYVTKVCAICWDNFEVCPECLLKYEKIVCPACIQEGIRDDGIDRLKSVVEKYSLKQALQEKEEAEE